MVRTSLMTRVAAFTLAAALVPAPLLAATTNGSETTYASVLRSINPKLQQHQSRRFAASLLASAQRNRIDARLLAALVTVESHWHPDAVSYAGARGLGQLMPATAATLGVDPRDPAENLRGAASYLRRMVDRFADRGANGLRDAIGAYNAGPKAVEAFHGIPPYAETQNYVRKVLVAFRSLRARLGVGEAKKAPVIAIASDEAMWIGQHASALPATALGVTTGTSADR